MDTIQPLELRLRLHPDTLNLLLDVGGYQIGTLVAMATQEESHGGGDLGYTPQQLRDHAGLLGAVLEELQCGVLSFQLPEHQHASRSLLQATTEAAEYLLEDPDPQQPLDGPAVSEDLRCLRTLWYE